MKCFFLDIDGVIYKDGVFNKKVLETIKKNGAKYIFCTGRGYLRCLDIVKDYANIDDIIILENGGQIRKNGKMQYYEIPLTIKKIIKSINPEEIEYIIFSKKQTNEYYSYGKEKLLHVKYNYVNFNNFLECMYNNNICQITIKFKYYENKKKFLNKCKKRNIEYKLSENYVIINAKGINKKTAIEYVIKNNNLNKDDCIIVGNDYNDIDMFDINCYKKIGVLDNTTPIELKRKSTDLISFEKLSELIEKIL